MSPLPANTRPEATFEKNPTEGGDRGTWRAESAIMPRPTVQPGRARRGRTPWSNAACSTGKQFWLSCIRNQGRESQPQVPFKDLSVRVLLAQSGAIFKSDRMSS